MRRFVAYAAVIMRSGIEGEFDERRCRIAKGIEWTIIEWSEKLR